MFRLLGLRRKIKDLKRKLVDELDRVRKMAWKLEEKEIQLTEYSSIGGETTVPVGHLQFPVNGGIEKGMGGGLRMISDTGSFGFNGSRPSRQLSVSLMNNNHHGIIQFFSNTPESSALCTPHQPSQSEF